MKNKYHSRKIRVGGLEFDSEHEYRHWKELELLQRAGEISDLQRQVKFELIPKQTERYERYSRKTGKRLKDGERVVERACNYIADFTYKDKNGVLHVEDTKVESTKTTEYIIKRKLMLERHGVKIEEVLSDE